MAATLVAPASAGYAAAHAPMPEPVPTPMRPSLPMSQDWPALIQRAHSMKCGAAMMGANSLSGAAAAMEIALQHYLSSGAMGWGGGDGRW